MNHGKTAYLRNPTGDPNRRSIPTDVHDTECWTMFHSGGVHTHPHSDTAGLGTHAYIDEGAKAWIIHRDADVTKARTREEFHTATENTLIGADNLPPGTDCFVVTVVTGDYMYVRSS